VKGGLFAASMKTLCGLGNFVNGFTNRKVIRNIIRFIKHSDMSDANGTSVATEPSSLARAMTNEVGIQRDMVLLSKFVRKKLFSFVVHDLKNKNDIVLSDTGEPCKTFIRFLVGPQNSVNNTHILEAPEEDLRQYLKFLWNKGLSEKGKGNIRQNLSMEKSAVYAAIENSFKSK
jgi:hypothetical protein